MLSLPLASTTETATIRVFISDYAEVSPVTREGARTTATAILERAGLRVEWAECAVREGSGDFPCDGMQSRDIHLRILNAALAKGMGTSRNCLGYAIRDEGFGGIAAVYLHRVVELERQRTASRQAILGAVMAHEIGHLLLPEMTHSTIGLMRGNWNDADLKALAQGRFGFCEAQARRMVSMAAERVEERNRAAALALAQCR